MQAHLGGAYPRSRGGTGFDLALPVESPGLSPLARGNLNVVNSTATTSGPIPARAGEPLTNMASVRAMGAYPRSRGGTDGTIITDW